MQAAVALDFGSFRHAGVGSFACLPPLRSSNLLYAHVRNEKHKLTRKFVLRRTKDVIRGSLPPALEIIVFCRISQRQLSLYERCIAESSATAAFFVDDGAAPGTPLRASFREVLPLISTLRRLCNHPDLVVGNSGGGGLIGANNFDDGHLREKLPNQVMDDGINDEDSDSDDLAFLLVDAKEGEERGRARSREKENTQANGIDVGRGGCRGSWELPPPAKTGAGAEAGLGIGRGVDGATDTTRGFARGMAVTAARYATEDSGKLVVLEALLRSIRQEFPGDKVRSLRYFNLHPKLSLTPAFAAVWSDRKFTGRQTRAVW